MVGIPQEATTDPILHGIDQFDAIGVSTRASYRTGLTGLLTHARRTRILLENHKGVQPLQPAPYSLAEVNAVYKFLTGETAQGVYAHDESRRAGVFLRNHMNSRDRWHPTANNPTTGAPCTLADREVFYFPETKHRIAGPGGLQVDPAHPPTPSTPSTGRGTASAGVTPSSLRHVDAAGNTTLSDGGVTPGGIPITVDSFPDDSTIADETGESSETGGTGVTKFAEVKKKLLKVFKGKGVDRGNDKGSEGGAGASTAA